MSIQYENRFVAGLAAEAISEALRENGEDSDVGAISFNGKDLLSGMLTSHLDKNPDAKPNLHRPRRNSHIWESQGHLITDRQYENSLEVEYRLLEIR